VQMIFSYKLTNLPKGVVIYSRVYAVTSVGDGIPLSSNASFSIDAPSSPTISSVDSGRAGSLIYFRVSWTPPADYGGGPASPVSLLSYSVSFSLSPEFLIPMVFSVSSSSNSTLVQSLLLKKGSHYFIRVSAVNSVGSSSPSGVIQKQLVVPPSQPQEVQLVVSGPLKLNLSWRMPFDLGAGENVPYNFSGYRVRIFLSLQSTTTIQEYSIFYLNPAALSMGINSFQGQPLRAGQSYSADIAALNDAENGIGDSSQPVQKIAVDISAKPASVILCRYNAWTFGNAGSCTASEPLSLILSWNRPEETGGGNSINVPILFYEVSLSTVDTVIFKSSVDSSTTSNIFTYKFIQLSRDVPYIATVTAFTYVGPGAIANSTLQYAVDIPRAPIVKLIQTQNSMGYQYLVIIWRIPEDTGSSAFAQQPLILSYDINIMSSLNGVSFTETKSMYSTPLQDIAYQQSAEITYTTAQSISKGATYSVRVRASNAVGSSHYSDVSNLTVTGYPDSPTNVKLLVTSPLGLKLQWVAPHDLGAGPGVPYTRVVYEYISWRWASGSAPQSFPDLAVWTRMSGGWNQSVLVLGNLTRGYIYRASVRAVNLDIADISVDLKGLGGGVRQDDDSQGVQVLGTPSAPSNFSLSPHGDKSLMATWNLPADTGTGFSLSRDLSEVGYEIQINSSDFQSTISVFRSNLLLQLVGINDYKFRARDYVSGRIRALNLVGQSTWSDFATSQVLNLPGIPSQVDTSYTAEEPCPTGCVSTDISLSASFQAPFETGLESVSTVGLLDFFRIRILCLTCCGNIVLSPPRYFTIEPEQNVTTLIKPLTKVRVHMLQIFLLKIRI
jgi:hypothetical protein